MSLFSSTIKKKVKFGWTVVVVMKQMNVKLNSIKKLQHNFNFNGIVVNHQLVQIER